VKGVTNAQAGVALGALAGQLAVRSAAATLAAKRTANQTASFHERSRNEEPPGHGLTIRHYDNKYSIVPKLSQKNEKTVNNKLALQGTAAACPFFEES
jgi:hypothetical protein